MVFCASFAAISSRQSNINVFILFDSIGKYTSGRLYGKIVGLFKFWVVLPVHFHDKMLKNC